MSYIDKNSTVVVSARMTNEGRKLLSQGLLNFSKFRLGDSNIDYSTLGTDYNITEENIIRAKAENPDIKTPLLPTQNAGIQNSYVSLPTVPLTLLQTLTQAPRIGFFNYGSGTTLVYTASTDTSCYILQNDAIIPLSGVSGDIIPVRQAPSYGSNTYEPRVGDVMMVKMNNDELVSALSQNVVDSSIPVPYLWYKIQSLTGSLSANTLQVELDRDFANFSNYTGSNSSWVKFYPLGESDTSTSYNPNKLFSDGGFYSGGCVWNMNNVWSYPIPGVVDATHENFELYGSETYIGSKTYLGYPTNSGCNIIPSVSLIHYSNKESCYNQTEQKYGQKLYVDTSLNDVPKLIVPTLMWHKDYSGDTIGHVFNVSGTPQYVSGFTSNSDNSILYYDLIDKYSNKVGRAYPQLHMFAIDNQELISALSYKSNRNWTLPKLVGDLQVSNDGVIDATDNLYITYLFESNSGYTTGLHCQDIICVNFEKENYPPTTQKSVSVQFPAGELPFMKTSGGTGWYADKFYLLVQRTELNENPVPENWKIIDYTSAINGHTVGTRINPINLESTVFTITDTDYLGGSSYDLSNFINIPQDAETDRLQFGDERFFYGNIEATAATNKYRTKFTLAVTPTSFNWTSNPTYPNSGQVVHISECGIYDANNRLVAIGKMNLPIEKVTNATIIIEIAFDL